MRNMRQVRGDSSGPAGPLFPSGSLILTLPPPELTATFSIVSLVPPDSIFGANLVKWNRADSGDISGTTWNDRTSNNNDFVTGSAGAAPTYSASDATCGNRGTFTCDGVDDTIIDTTLDLPVPGTTNVYQFTILKQLAWTSGRVVIGGGTTAQCALNQTGASPELRMNNGGASSLADTTNAAIGTWVLVEQFFNNATTDFLRVGAAGADVTGINTGNTNPVTGRALGSRNGVAATFSNAAFAEHGVVTGLNLAAINALRGSLRTYVQSYYSGAVATP